MRICKHCGKNIYYSDLNKEKVINIDICPNCHKPLEDSFTKKYTKEEEFLEDLEIVNMIEERSRNDDGTRYTLDEVRKKRAALKIEGTEKNIGC